MDVSGPFFEVLLRSIVVLFPLTVSWLAFRRLARSQSANSWTYAVICLLSVVIAAGILPWTLGLTSANMFLILLAFVCPVVWMATIFVFDFSREHSYGSDPLIVAALKTAPKIAPLFLTERERDFGEPLVFRHRTVEPEIEQADQDVPTGSGNAIVQVAREIRGNRNSDRRRPKLLPPPKEAELTFIRRKRDV